MLAGKEITGKSSDRVGGGDEVAGVLEAGIPFPPAQSETETNEFSRAVKHGGALRRSVRSVPDVQWKRLGRCEALWESSRLGDMPREEGGVAMPHREEGLHRGSFPPQEEFSSLFEFCTNTNKQRTIRTADKK